MWLSWDQAFGGIHLWLSKNGDNPKIWNLPTNHFWFAFRSWGQLSRELLHNKTQNSVFVTSDPIKVRLGIYWQSSGATFSSHCKSFFKPKKILCYYVISQAHLSRLVVWKVHIVTMWWLHWRSYILLSPLLKLYRIASIERWCPMKKRSPYQTDVNPSPKWLIEGVFGTYWALLWSNNTQCSMLCNCWC